MTPLMVACKEQKNLDTSIVEALLHSGADINAASFSPLDQDSLLGQYEGWTALHVASKHCTEACVELLIQKGAHVNANNPRSLITPLFEAVSEGRSECARLLICRGADLMTVSSRQQTVLHIAVAAGNLEMVQLIVDCVE